MHPQGAPQLSCLPAWKMLLNPSSPASLPPKLSKSHLLTWHCNILMTCNTLMIWGRKNPSEKLLHTETLLPCCL